jgi:hypothetical protein
MAPRGVEVEVTEGRSVVGRSRSRSKRVGAEARQRPIPSLQRLFDRLGLGFVAAQWAR